MSQSREPSWSAKGALRLPWASLSWLEAEALETLAELNEQGLELLCEQSAACAPSAGRHLLCEFEARWGALDVLARRRAARCPFLLFDAGFTSAGSLPWQSAAGIRDQDRTRRTEAFFTVPRTVQVARLVLIYAWHLAHSERGAARLFLGMSAECAERLARCTLSQVVQVAEREPGVLMPRWSRRAGVWCELLSAAASAEATAMDRFRMRGLQLIAADVLGAAAGS